MSKTILSISEYNYTNRHALHNLSTRCKIAHGYSLIFNPDIYKIKIKHLSGLIKYGAIIAGSYSHKRSIHIFDKYIIDDNYANRYYIFDDCFGILQDIKSLTEF